MTFPPLILPVLVHDLSSPDSTSPPSSNQTDLATSAGSSLDSRSLTNVLVVTTTVGMFNWVHCNTTDLRPAVSLDLVEALPMCWWLPPPWGCSTGFIATPRTLGQLFLLTLYLWEDRPAFSIGLSIRPPPATIPIIARFADGRTFFAPDGNLTLVFLVSGLCAMTWA